VRNFKMRKQQAGRMRKKPGRLWTGRIGLSAIGPSCIHCWPLLAIGSIRLISLRRLMPDAKLSSCDPNLINLSTVAPASIAQGEGGLQHPLTVLR